MENIKALKGMVKDAFRMCKQRKLRLTGTCVQSHHSSPVFSKAQMMDIQLILQSRGRSVCADALLAWLFSKKTSKYCHSPGGGSGVRKL